MKLDLSLLTFLSLLTLPTLSAFPPSHHIITHNNPTVFEKYHLTTRRKDIKNKIDTPTDANIYKHYYPHSNLKEDSRSTPEPVRKSTRLQNKKSTIHDDLDSYDSDSDYLHGNKNEDGYEDGSGWSARFGEDVKGSNGFGLSDLANAAAELKDGEDLKDLDLVGDRSVIVGDGKKRVRFTENVKKEDGKRMKSRKGEQAFDTIRGGNVERIRFEHVWNLPPTRKYY